MEKILSLQSHTVYGYVGNKAAVFPLQLLGFEVSPINSVQFSNHTGYPQGFKGEVLSGAQLHQLQQGLAQNNILSQFNGVLTGYIGSASFLQQVVTLVKTLKNQTAGLFYCCDPVLGDHGRGFYVPEALVADYKAKVLPLADMITPNQFEVEQLTGTTIHTQNDVLHAIAHLHSMGPKRIVVTSTQFGDNALYASVRSTEGNTVVKATFTQIEGSFTGTGDLFTALLLGWTRMHPNDMPLALSNSLQTMQAVLHNTKTSIENGANNERELQLVASRDAIITPPQAFSIAISPCKST